MDRLYKGENKTMDETAKVQCEDGKCPDCAARAQEVKASEENALAFLVALMPLMTITLFGNMGLF